MQRVRSPAPAAPLPLDYVNTVFTDFVELTATGSTATTGHRGRLGAADGISVMLIDIRRARHQRKTCYRNFGMAHPEGYRKAMRAHAPGRRSSARRSLTLVDTPAPIRDWREERGQAEAIAAA